MNRKFFVSVAVVLISILLLAGCYTAPATQPQTQPNEVATAVALTLAANSTGNGQQATTAPQQPADTPIPIQSTATWTPSPAPNIGTVTGDVCFPSEYIPAMNAYFQDTVANTATTLPIAENQSTYTIDLSPGNYTAYVWLTDFSAGGSYSLAVPCGLTVSCTDHTLLPFNVTAGQTTQDIDLCDWYGGPFNVPYPPGVNPVGSITGSLSFPSEYIPPLNVVAFSLNTAFWYYVATVENQSTYTISNLPPGQYNVVAYTQSDGFAGGYSQMVPCGLSVNCTDHSLISVTVTANQTTTGIDPGDWYAPAGSFPPDPTP